MYNSSYSPTFNPAEFPINYIKRKLRTRYYKKEKDLVIAIFEAFKLIKK